MSRETSPKQTPSLEMKMGIRHRTVSFIEFPPSHLYSLLAASPQPYYGLLFPTLTSSHTQRFLCSTLLPQLPHLFPHYCRLLSGPILIYQTLSATRTSMSAMKSNMLSLVFQAQQPVQESSFSNGCDSDPFHEPRKQASQPMLVNGSMEDVSVFVKHEVLGVCWHKGYIFIGRKKKQTKTQYQQRISSIKKRTYFNYVL